MRTHRDLHLFLILATVGAYMDEAIKDGTTKEAEHIRIASGINGWLTFRKLNKKEAALLTEMGEDAYMQELKKVEVAFIVYSLELLKLAVEQYNFSIGVGRKHLRKGRSIFALGMIEKKRKDKEKYKELKHIIDESVLCAKKFFCYTEERIKEMR